jgi:hypothetical protein
MLKELTVAQFLRRATELFPTGGIRDAGRAQTYLET